MTQPIYYQNAPAAADPWAVDRSHLKTLAICHYVWGGLTIAVSSLAILYIIIGVMFVTGTIPVSTGPRPTAGQPPPPPPEPVGWMFVAGGSCALVFGWGTGILTILAGRGLARQRSRTLSLIMAGVNCLSVPIGTTLGIFTFVVLFRPSVQALYDQNKVYGP